MEMILIAMIKQMMFFTMTLNTKLEEKTDLIQDTNELTLTRRKNIYTSIVFPSYIPTVNLFILSLRKSSIFTPLKYPVDISFLDIT